MPWRIPLLLLALALPLSISHASIHLENRDLFLEFDDLEFPPDLPHGGLLLQRVYNSKSPFTGWFGPGWGSTLEVHLSAYPDGSIIVQEFGGGAEILFQSPSSKAMLESSIHALVQWATARGNFGTAEQKNQYIQKVRDNASFREQEFRIALAAKKIQAPPIPKGTQFVSAQFEYQYITKTETGFSRRLEDGTYQLFDQSGRIITIQTEGRTWQIEYNAHGLISSLIAPDNKRLSFHFNRQGFMESISREDGAAIAYSYSDAHDLIRVQLAPNNAFTYRYDPNQRHLLMEAVYPDGTKVDAQYEDYRHGEDLKYYRERNGNVTELKSNHDAADPMHLSFETIETPPKGQPTKTVIDYFDRAKANGERWTYRRKQTQGNWSTETLFSESCRKPVLILRGTERIESVYDPYCRISRWSSVSGEYSSVLNYTYYKATDHLTQFQKKDKPGTNYSVAFVYDSTGRLIGAKESTGSSFLLFYGSDGRLSRITNESGDSINVTLSDLPPRIGLQSPKIGSWTIPSKAEPSPQQKKLIDAWDKLVDLIRRSNNPLPM